MSIRILSDNLINQISAGEVVERPASVVKELVENAIDAGSTRIDIDIIDGGRTMICVSDNGSGMNKEDLIKSVSRHATSKISGDDLLNITTMGFRGEALPSIASVSEMEIKTSKNGESWSLDVSNPSNPILKPDNLTIGTKIFVKNLFLNTPARLKFLRSDRAETSAIIDWVKMLSLAHPDIYFNVNKKWIYTPGNIQNRISSVLGNDITDNLLYLEENDEEIKLHGYITKPTYHRATSDAQFLFVNGRVVKDKVLLGALRAGYFDVMSAREYPACVLYLEMPTNFVDVNVHPAKTEVHFLYPARVRSLLIASIRNTIAKTLKNTVIETIQNTSNNIKEDNTEVLYQMDLPTETYNNTLLSNNSCHNYQHQTTKQIYPVEKQLDSLNNATNDDIYEMPLGRAIGQIMNAFILSDAGDNFIIVDQHAAHERIVYETLKKERADHNIRTQTLLVPEIIELGELTDIILENINIFTDFGILLEQFGEDAIIIRSTPADLELDWTTLIKEMALQIKNEEPGTLLSEMFHKKLATYACHHSVRAGQKLDLNQMNELLRLIERTERAGQCNHGRPVYKIFKKSDLEKIFERI